MEIFGIPIDLSIFQLVISTFFMWIIAKAIVGKESGATRELKQFLSKAGLAKAKPKDFANLDDKTFLRYKEILQLVINSKGGKVDPDLALIREIMGTEQ